MRGRFGLVCLVAVGDVEFSGMYLGRYEEKNKRFPPFEAAMRQHAEETGSVLILDWLREADIAFANLETTLAENKPYYPSRPTTYRFRADPNNAVGLKNLGMDIVSLANNHVFDFGESAFVETLKALEDAGVKHVGAGMNLEEAYTPVFFEIDGLRLAFLGVATVFPIAGVAGFDCPGVAAIRNKLIYEFETTRLPTDLRQGYAPLPRIYEVPVEEDVEMVRDHIRRVKEEADFLIVSVHWGREYEDTPSEGQMKLGHGMIDGGADMIIGHHPHTAQSIESYKGKYIFYSLGNFAMQVEWDIARCEAYLNEAFMLRAYIDKGKVSKVEILPTRTDRTGLPILSEDSHNVIKHLESLSSPLNVEVIEKGKIAYVKQTDSACI
jgi:poly-gamma-glutamate synthesis protein (capsule biosynthesis protein)